MRLINFYIGVIVAASLGLTGCEQIQTKLSPKMSKTSKVTKTTPGSKLSKAEDSADAVSSQNPASSVKPVGYLLDVNEASPEKLDRVPGMTPEIKTLILSTRPFLDMVEFDDELDLLNVSEKDRMKLYKHVFMVIDINNGVPEDLNFVPQLSNSAVHAVKSARPYAKRDDLKAVLKKTRQKDEVNAIMPYFKVVPVKSESAFR